MNPSRTLQPSSAAAANAAQPLLGRMVHELRSTLASIQTWSEVLQVQLPPDAPQLARACAGIRAGVEQQVRVLDEAIDASLAMSQQLRLVTEPMSLLPMLESAVAEMRRPALERRLLLDVELEAAAAVRVHADAARTRQIVALLLRNALRRTPAGGRIGVRVERDDAQVRIRIDDSGPAIAPERRATSFEWPDASAAPREPGLGVALPLAQHIAQLHGGHVDVDDGPDGGACFAVHLPLLAEAAAAHEQAGDTAS